MHAQVGQGGALPSGLHALRDDRDPHLFREGEQTRNHGLLVRAAVDIANQHTVKLQQLAAPRVLLTSDELHALHPSHDHVRQERGHVPSDHVVAVGLLGKRRVAHGNQRRILTVDAKAGSVTVGHFRHEVNLDLEVGAEQAQDPIDQGISLVAHHGGLPTRNRAPRRSARGFATPSRTTHYHSV